MKSIFKSSANYTKEFINPLFKRLIKKDKLDVYGNHTYLPNLKNKSNDGEFIGIMTTKGFMPSSEDEKTIFPHRASMELISNKWDILELFNRNPNMPNNYEVFTKVFYNNKYIGIRNLPLNYNLNYLINTIDSYIKEFYSNRIDSLLFKEDFIKDNKKNSYKLYKLFENNRFPDSIKALENYPYYTIRYKINITDIVNNNDINLLESDVYEIEKDSNNNYYTIATVMIFPFNKVINFLIYDSDLVVFCNSESYQDIEDIDTLINDSGKEVIKNYYLKIEDMKKERNDTKVFINNSPLSEGMKTTIINMLNNISNNINTTINLTNCDQIENQNIDIIFGNLFNNLLYEYKTNTSKYMILFDEFGESVKLINKPSDIPLLKSTYLLNSNIEDKRNIVKIYNDRYNLKNAMANIFYNNFMVKFKKYNFLVRLNNIFIKMMTEFLDKYNLHEEDQRGALPALDYDIKYFTNGFDIKLRLFYFMLDADLKNSYKIFIAKDLLTYSFYNNKVRVNVNKPIKLDLDSFSYYMAAKLNIRLKKGNTFQEDVCVPFIENFIDHFKNIKPVKRSLLSLSKLYMNKIVVDEDIVAIFKEWKKYLSNINKFKHSCEEVNALDNLCNNIRYSNSESISKFLLETKYYIDWNYNLREIV